MLALITAPVIGVGSVLVPAVAVGAGAIVAGATAAVVTAQPAQASGICPTGGSALVFPNSVNGGSSSAEATEAAALGCTVTMFSSSAVSGMTQAQMIAYFGGFTVIVIGDQSTSTCASSVPSDALTYAPDWGPAIDGNITVLGTAPVFAGSSGTALIDDGLTWAVSGGSSTTGLYASLNCEYSSVSASTAAPLLASVAGGGFAVTGQSASCPNSGSVNPVQALAESPFAALAGAATLPWTSSACEMQETFNAWSGGVTALAYDAGATPASFTATNATTGQPFILTGTAASATLGLSPSTGGQVPKGAQLGGSNPAAPGVTADTAGDPVDTENGDFTQSNGDFSIPTFGPSLDFTRTYDAALARQETVAGSPVTPGAPGSMGYGWTDDWDSSLATGVPVPGDVYAIDGTRSDPANGSSPTATPEQEPGAVAVSGGDTYIADSSDNRILEIAGSSGTQWGQSMTAGAEYVIAGSPAGIAGRTANGTAASASLLNDPEGLALDSSGNLYIADTGNNRVVEIPVVAGQNRGFGTMTVGDAYTIAGHGTGGGGHGGDGGEADDAFLEGPAWVSTGHLNSDIYVADSGNSRIQEVPAASGTQWGQSMTAFDIYTVAGNVAGSTGCSANGTAAASALLDEPDGITFNSGGNMFIADTENNRVEEVPVSTGGGMTADDLYTVAGSTTCASGHSANGTAATSALLNEPNAVEAFNGGQLYIADFGDNRVEEVAATGHTEWGISMAAGDIYTIAGTGTAGFSGDGGAATSAKLNTPVGLALDGSFNLYIADSENNRIREISASTGDISEFSGSGLTLKVTGDNGPATGGGLSTPYGVASDPQGDVFIADAGNNRVQEIAASSHSQFGISMTAGDVYTVAGSAAGAAGTSGNGVLATSALLANPLSVAVDSSGDLFIDDADNNRVTEVPAASGTFFGQPMTANKMYTVAGNVSGTPGISGDGGVATSGFLNVPTSVATDRSGDVLIADSTNNRVQEVPAVTGGGKTAGDMYTIAGDPGGTPGSTGDGGSATAALLQNPFGVAVSPAGDLYIGDSANNRVQEVPAANGTQWGQAMTGGDMYTIAGSATTSGATGDNGLASVALLDFPAEIAIDSWGNLYVSDAQNNRVQEIAAANGIQWGQAMTRDDIYTVAGSPAGTPGTGGLGGRATSAKFAFVYGIGVDPNGDLYLSDNTNNEVDEVIANSDTPFGTSPAGTGVTITQDDGSQVTFYPVGAGCGAQAPYTHTTASGQYCTLPENVSANLSFSSAGGGTYTYSPDPGDNYTYGSNGAINGETDATGDALTITYGSPAPGTGNCPALANWCQTITSASGRALTIGYNSANLVISAADPMGREWTYAYTGSDLTSATDPMGNKTTYTYGAGSTGNPQLANDMLTITGPNAQPGGPDAGDDTVNVYDSSGRVTGQTDPMGNQTQFNYCVSASNGHCMNSATGTGMTTVTDSGGNTTIDSYSLGSLTGKAQLTGGTTLASAQIYVPDQSNTGTSADTQLDTATVDGDGNITAMTYDSAGNVTTSTSPDGVGAQTATTSQTSTAMNDQNCSSTPEATVTCASNPGPATVTAGGAITPPSSVPPAGLTWTLYDNDDNELYSTTGVYQPGSSTASYAQTTYQLFKNNTVTLSGTHISCTATPPSLSLPCATIDANGVVTQLGYNAQGDLTSSSTPDGNGTELATTTYSYDNDGEQTSTVSPDGNITGANKGDFTTVATYNNDGQQTAVSEGDGSGHTVTARVTQYGYDANGNQTTVEDARGNTTTTTYNADDEAVLASNPDGDTTLTCYDGNGNVTETVPPVGVAANSLTPSSCPATYPSGYGDRLASDATTYTFDASGNQTTTTTPAPAGQTGHETTTTTYDGNGNPTKTTAPPASGTTDQVTYDTYNSVGALATQTTGYGTPAASTTSFCYDPNGDQTSEVMPDGNTSAVASCETSYPWVVSATAFPTEASYQTTDAYDSVGDVASTTSPATTAAPSGATTTYTYDADGNTLTSTDPNGVTGTDTYTPTDLLATVSYSGSPAAHSVSYTYDASGQRTAMTDASGSSSYTYDAFGEISVSKDGAGNTVAYGHDLDGDVTGVTYPLPGTATWASTNTVAYGYDPADELTAVTDFNNHTIAITPTADGLSGSEVLGSTGDTIAVTYAPTGRVAKIALSNVSSTLQSFSYSDTQAGNVATETDNPTSSDFPATYTYNVLGRAASMASGSGSPLNYSTDTSGNLTELPTEATATYNDASELTSSTAGSTTTDYTYDADGQRLSETQGSSATVSAAWNGANELTSYDASSADMSAATYDGDGLRTSATIGSGTQSFIWNTTSTIPELLADSANAYIYGSDGVPVEQVTLSTGSITYLVSDAIGSVRGTVNSSGALTATTSYDAWGNPLSSGGLTASTPFGFAGGYTDSTGLLYLQNRYSDPQTGQFVSVDPDVDQTSEPYSYASDDPVSLSDPAGLSATGGPIGGGGGFAYKKSSPFYVLPPSPWVDKHHNLIPLRVGFKDDQDAENPDGFGFYHYALNHNISDRRVIGEAIEKGSRIPYSKHPEAYGDRWNYLIKVYNTNLYDEWGELWVENILVGVSLDFDYKHHELKDAMPLGVVTAFCPRTSRKVNGVSKCPLFVSDGAWTFDGEGNISHPGPQ